MTRRANETALHQNVKDSRLRIHVCGDRGSEASTLAARLRDASEDFLPTESSASSARELVEKFAETDAAVVVTSPGTSEEALRRVVLAAVADVGRVIVAVDKLDAASDARSVFSKIEADVRRSSGESELHVVPVAVLSGHNVVERGGFEWYLGPSLVELVEPAPRGAARRRAAPFRMHVLSLASDAGPAGCRGTIASGSVRKGDRVRVQGQGTEVVRIVANGREIEEASVGDSVELRLGETFEISQGDLISTADHPAETANQFEATIVWFDETPLLRGRNYAFEIGSAQRTATIGSLKRRIDPGASARSPQKFEQDEVGVCHLRLDHPIGFDAYRENPATGGFRLLDVKSGATVGIGMLHFALRRAQNVHWQAIDVNKGARSSAKGQRPCVLWYTGLSGAGKSTIANLVDKKLHAMGRHTYLLDGDNVRHGLNKDLGFTAADRVENIRRIAEVAKLMVDAGLIVGTAFISPFRAERSMARALLGQGEFIEIFVDTPLGVAEQRDPKGLYKKARRGELKNFTGIDSPYEAPEEPELRIDTTAMTPEAAADLVVSHLEQQGVLEVE